MDQIPQEDLPQAPPTFQTQEAPKTGGQLESGVLSDENGKAIAQIQQHPQTGDYTIITPAENNFTKEQEAKVDELFQSFGCGKEFMQAATMHFSQTLDATLGKEDYDSFLLDIPLERYEKAAYLIDQILSISNEREPEIIIELLEKTKSYLDAHNLSSCDTPSQINSEEALDAAFQMVISSTIENDLDSKLADQLYNYFKQDNATFKAYFKARSEEALCFDPRKEEDQQFRVTPSHQGCNFD